MNNIVVTTGDIAQPYDILGPVYFQVSNKGLFGSTLDKLKNYYSAEIQRMRAHGEMSRFKADWGFLYGEYSVGQNDFEAAFYIATQELKKRAKLVGADAIICMRQDIDLDTSGFTYFYLQMYGTAVKIREVEEKPSISELYETAEDLMSKGNFIEAEAIYFQLGDFRDSKDKAKAAYAESLSAKYNKAMELMLQKDYLQAKHLFISLRDYKDSKERAEIANSVYEDWKASTYSAKQNSADNTQRTNRSWICPDCGKENVFFISKCSCGFSR